MAIDLIYSVIVLINLSGKLMGNTTYSDGTRALDITMVNMSLFSKAKSNLTYCMAQQPLKSFDCPLMRVSSSNSVLVTLIFY